MASPIVLNALTQGGSHYPNAFGAAQERGQRMRANEQMMGQNALNFRNQQTEFGQQQEDRQSQMQSQNEQRQLQGLREDYARFMQLPDDNARTQTWQQGLAQHYGQDPASDWKPAIEQLTRRPGFLPPEVANKMLANMFAPTQPELTSDQRNAGAYAADPNFRKFMDRPTRTAPETQNAPSGYRRTATGLEAEPGGPADPANPLNARKAAGGGTLTVDPETGQVVMTPSGANLKEGEGKAVTYAIRAISGLKKLEEIEGAGYQPENLSDRVANSLPGGNFMMSQSGQKYNQAASEFLAAILRKDTGAAVTKEEWSIYGNQFFPRAGDGPDVIAQKREARRVAYSALKSGSGAGGPLIPALPSNTPQTGKRRYNPETGRIE